MHGRNVADEHGHPSTGPYGRPADLVFGANARIRAHQKGLAGALHEVGTDRDVSALEGLGELGKRDAVSRHAAWVRLDHQLFFVAADRIDSGNSLDTAELGADDPILDRPQIGGLLHIGRQTLAIRGEERAVGLKTGLPGDHPRFLRQRSLVIDRPHQDFAEASRQRAHLGLNRFGKALARLIEAFGNLLPREEDIHAVLEDHRYLAEAIARDRARAF